MSRRAATYGRWSICSTYFGRDGREEAEEMLERRSGNPDKPRILQAFNQPCDDWLNSSASRCSPTATASTSWRRSLKRIRAAGANLPVHADRGGAPYVRRRDRHGSHRQAHGAADEAENDDVRELGGIPLDIIQKYINYWYTYSLDLFGGEISSNSADFFAAGIKGRYRSRRVRGSHCSEGNVHEASVENGRLVRREIPVRNALNEVLRAEYVERLRARDRRDGTASSPKGRR